MTWWAALIAVLVSVAKSLFGLDKPVKETLHEIHPDLNTGTDGRLDSAFEFRVHNRPASGNEDCHSAK